MGKSAKALKRPSRQQREIKKANSEESSDRALKSLKSRITNGGVTKPNATKVTKAKKGGASLANKLKKRAHDGQDSEEREVVSVPSASGVVLLGQQNGPSTKPSKKGKNQSKDYLRLFEKRH